MRAIRKEFIGTILLAMFFGVYALAHDNRGKDGSKESAYRLGYEDGHRDGLRHGEEDYRRGIGFDPSSHELKDAGKGVSVKHKGDFKKGYREGYNVGYRDGYESRGINTTGRYPDRYPYPDRPDSRYPYPDRDRGYGRVFDMGLEQGRRDGLEKGQSDYNKNRSPDVRRHDWYRDADRGYHSSEGNKSDYQAGYRRGFEEGYNEAYGRRGGYRRTSSGSVWDNIFRGRWP